MLFYSFFCIPKYVSHPMASQLPKDLILKGTQLHPALHRATKFLGQTAGKVKIGCRIGLRSLLSSECAVDCTHQTCARPALLRFVFECCGCRRYHVMAQAASISQSLPIGLDPHFRHVVSPSSYSYSPPSLLPSSYLSPIVRLEQARHSSRPASTSLNQTV